MLDMQHFTESQSSVSFWSTKWSFAGNASVMLEAISEAAGRPLPVTKLELPPPRRLILSLTELLIKDELLGGASLNVLDFGLRLPWWRECAFVVWETPSRKQDDLGTGANAWGSQTDSCSLEVLIIELVDEAAELAASAIPVDPWKYAWRCVAKEARRDSETPERCANDGLLNNKSFICHAEAERMKIHKEKTYILYKYKKKAALSQ